MNGLSYKDFCKQSNADQLKMMQEMSKQMGDDLFDYEDPAITEMKALVKAEQKVKKPRKPRVKKAKL
jgi:hypothetical protein